MSVARILIAQSGVAYRFLKFESGPDGSIYVMLDRDARSGEHLTLDQGGVFVSTESPAGVHKTSARFSVHTSGSVNYHSAGQLKDTIFLEPLYALTRPHLFAVISIPRPTLLDTFQNKHSGSHTSYTLDIPENTSERLTFVLDLAPKAQALPTFFGAVVTYETCRIVVRAVPDFLDVDGRMREHFVHGIPTVGAFSEAQADRPTSELEYYGALSGGAPVVLREKQGSYVALAAQRMGRAPELRVTFDRDDLSAEQISFNAKHEPTHKVRFWIRDKSGRNRNDDLRRHIRTLEYHAEL